MTIPVTILYKRLRMDSSGRRDELVRLLRRGAHLTAEHLALALGVSRRTVLRDIESLRRRGFAIDGDVGRGGGVRMDPRSVLVSAQFSTDEVVALILSVSVSRSMPWVPFAGLAERALAKIEGALPKNRLRELRRFMDRILIGEPTDWSGTEHCGAVDRSLLTIFEQALSRRCVLRLEYVDRFGKASSRLIEPHAMLLRAPVWYIVAWDLGKDLPRLFRMDRILTLVIDSERRFGSRPFDFVLGSCPDARPSTRRAAAE